MSMKSKPLDEEKAIELFLKANGHNWDLGYNALNNILKNKNCCLGTVSLIYWRANPEYFLAYKQESEVSDINRENWRFVQDVEKRLLSGHYRELISFDPASEVSCSGPIAGESRVRNLPAVVYRVTPGKLNAVELLNGLHGPGALNKSAKLNNVEMLSTLIDGGKDVNSKHEGNTPLIEATMAGALDAMKLLIDSGANVDMRGSDYCPIHVVQDIQALEILLKNNADVDALSHAGTTATHHVARGSAKASLNDVLTLLIQSGAEPNKKRRYDGATALHDAAHGGYINNLKSLLSAGWELSALDKSKKNVLHHAVEAMIAYPQGKKNKVPMIKELVKLGVSSDDLDNSAYSVKMLVTQSALIKVQKKDEVYRVLGISSN